MEFQVFQHGIEKVGAAKVGTDGTIQKASAKNEHFEKAPDAMRKNARHRCSFASFVGVFCPDGGVETEFFFPFMPVFIGGLC